MKLFISHASEDKEGTARPIAEKLRADGYSVWYDEYTLKVGQSLSQEIDKGLANCDFGVVILSPSFFSKNWPKRELAGLVAREVVEGRNVLLPVWHKIGAAEIVRFSPPLADRLAANTDKGIDHVVSELRRALGKPVRDPKAEYLALSRDERVNRISATMSIYCGDKDDLSRLLDAAVFLQIALATETDEELILQIQRAEQHVDEQARQVAEEMKQDNPSDGW